jgi:hypothetical protein
MTLQKTPFEIDLEKTITINGAECSLAYYKLFLTIRDLRIVTRTSLKPHKNWRLKDVKQYFGLKGSASTILERLEAFKNNEL